MIDRRDLLLGTLASGMASGVSAQVRAPDETIDLWPAGAPGMPAIPPIERIEDRSRDPAAPDRSALDIVRPRLMVFRPATPNGRAALIMPGGGYSRVVFDKEGAEVARWLTARGWTAYVLLYRLPGDGWAAGPDVALQDAQRAMRLIRVRHAAGRLAAIGFSAGGHLCADLATRFDRATYPAVDAADRLSARPDLFAPIYAVQSMSAPLAHPGSRQKLIGATAAPALERAHSTALNVTATTPPCFLVHAEDDTAVDSENSIASRAACRRAGVPVELHLFDRGGHGFGMRTGPGPLWPGLFQAWADARLGQKSSG